MAESAEKLFVARPEDVAALRAHFDAAAAGEGRSVLLQAPLGGGKRAAVGALVRELSNLDDDILVIRTAFLEEENGLRTLLRLYAGVYAALHRDKLLRGKVEMILNAQLPQHPKRVQGWFQAFIEGMKKGGPKDGEQKFDVTLPRDNPAVGFAEVVGALATKMPVLLDIQNITACQSLAVHALIEAMAVRAPGSKMMMLLALEPVNDERRAWYPSPLLEMLEKRADLFQVVEMGPWGEGEVAAYLASKELSGDAAGLARVSQGRPGFVAELSDALSEAGTLDNIPADATAVSLMPVQIDEDELDSDGEPAEGRSPVSAADLPELAWRASLLGRAFPSGLLADISAWDRDSVDDLLDAAGDLFEELQFSKGLGSWIYQFKRPVWWQATLQSRGGSEEDKQIIQRTARFLEQFLVPRGYEFLMRTARLYAQVGSPRAGLMRSMALTGDRPEMWGMTQDLVTWFKDIDWPDPMRRTVFMNLLDRMVNGADGGNVAQTEALYNQAMEWAQSKEDRGLQAWLLFAGSRLDFRRQDFYRARDRAKDALTLYTAQMDKVRAAEVHNHLAMIEFSDGNPNAALEQVNKALQVGQMDSQEEEGKKLILPQIAAQAEFIRGQVRRRENKWQEASEHFRRANEIAGRSNQAPLALESGLAFGETLLRGGQLAQAADVLERVLNIARGLNNKVRERAAAQLLAQAHGAQRNFESALKWANHTLGLTHELKFQRLAPIDTYQVGFFQLMLDRPSEALALFKQARANANLQQDPGFAKELLFNTGIAARRIGENGQAIEAFSAALPAAQAAKDGRRVMGANEALGDLAAEAGDKAKATAHFQAALKVADDNNLKEERKKLRRKIERL